MQLGRNEAKRILIVEDEMLLAMNLEDMVVEMGHKVVALATRLTQALEFANNSEIDLAILDLNLSGSLSFPVADVLRRRGIPFMFASGYGLNGLTDDYKDEVVLAKPYGAHDLENAIRSIASVEVASS